MCVTYASPGQYPRGTLAGPSFGQPFCGYDTIVNPNPLSTTEVWGGIIPCDEQQALCPAAAGDPDLGWCPERAYEAATYGGIDGAAPRFAPPCASGIYVYTVGHVEG